MGSVSTLTGAARPAPIVLTLTVTDSAGQNDSETLAVKSFVDQPG